MSKNERNRYPFTREQLVKAWNSSNSVAEAAGKLSRTIDQEVPPSAVSSRATYYRDNGEDLKAMPRGRLKKAATAVA